MVTNNAHAVSGPWSQGGSPASPCPRLNPCPFTRCEPDATAPVQNMLVRIGRDYDKSDTSMFDGNVDDLALFAAALSADEVKRDYVVGGGRVNTAHPYFTVMYDFDAAGTTMVPGARSATIGTGIFLGVRDIVAEWVASSAPLQSLAHVYNGRDRPTTGATRASYITQLNNTSLNGRVVPLDTALILNDRLVCPLLKWRMRLAPCERLWAR